VKPAYTPSATPHKNFAIEAHKKLSRVLEFTQTSMYKPAAIMAQAQSLKKKKKKKERCRW
jgi:hypothetical protein